ncbi:MAG: hypothetical protein HFG34_11235 [Eubacterium sp.]|nr:hypothetical protein [Eubacterium sp.]
MKICIYSILFIYLLIMSVYDVRRKEIHIGVTLLTGSVLAAIRVFQFYHEGVSLELVFGVVPGILVILLSYFTHGKIGMGDGFVLIVCGLVLSMYENIFLLFFALIMSAAAGVALMVFRQVKRSYIMPFVPFICVSFGLICLWELWI